MFDYDVMSEAEAMQERYQLLKDGEYDAVIIKSEDKVSANSGNPMMDMTLNVYDENGQPHTVRDFLVFTKNMTWKVLHCVNSAGLTKEYEDKKFCSDLIQNCRVRVKITTQKGGEIPQDKLQGKPLGSKYQDRNKVEDYVKNENQRPYVSAPKSNDHFKDDLDIPF